MALLTLADLEAAMGRASRPFSADEEGQAQVIIDAITAYIVSECAGIAFEEVTVTDEKMQADYYGILEIRKFPVIDITSVKNARDGNETWWDWDDFDTVYDLDPFETVLVDFSYGYATAPDDLVVVAKAMASRGMSNPQGIRQQTVGAISETYSAGGLTDYESKILDRYRPYGSSLRLGPQTGRNLRRLPTL
jgi:hypothetical protein